MTHKLTRLAALVLAVVMAFSVLLVPASAASFNDVSGNAWYKAAVDYVQERGWMAGVSETSFAPNKEVTRGMMVTVLARVAGAETGNAAAFTDTAEGKWYTGAAAWAAENGIVSGVGNGLFAPNRAITRQDLCVMLYKYVNLMGYELRNDVDRSFSDMDKVADYARDAVIYCTGVGLVSGFEDSSFRPKDTATRAQVAQLMMRLDLLVKEGTAPTEPMPAQSFDGEAGEDMSVSVNAPEGALPENTDMTVSRVTDEASLADYAEQIKGEVYAAADITFSKDGAELEPNADVEVQIALDGLENLKSPAVFHRRADGTVEKISSELVSINRDGNAKALRFYANSFSVYIIGDGSSANLLKVEFYNADGTLISMQALRLSTLNNAVYTEQGKDYIYDPGVPTITATQSFEGWADSNPFTEEQKGYSVEEINAIIKTNRATYMASTTDVTLKYYAKVYEVRYVVYHDQAGAVLMTQAFHVTVSGNTVQPANEEIDFPYVGFKGGQNFAGWVTDAAIEPYKENGEAVFDENGNPVLTLGDYPLYKDGIGTTYQVYLNDHTYQLNDTLQLYPYLNTGHTVVYDTWKDQDLDSTSTTFVSPDFYAEGEHTAAPEQPDRIGYRFIGWYRNPTTKQAENEAGEKLYIDNVTKELTTAATTNGQDNEKRMIVDSWGEEFIFGSALNEDVTLFARWEAKNTTYHISVWQQVSTDVVDDNNLNNKYAYYEPTTVDIVLTAKTGDKVSLAEAYKLLGNQNDSHSQYGEMGYYFVFNEARSNQENNGGEVVVRGDGTTVLNAYYDRKLITISFYTSSNMNTLWSGTAYTPVEEGQTGEYYYYTAPYDSGYYFVGTGPNSTLNPTSSSNSSVYVASSQSSYNTPATTYYANTSSLSSHTISRNYTYCNTSGQTCAGNATTYLHQFYRTGSWSYSYYPIYYSYTAPYATGYYPVTTGPNPSAAGTHNLVTLPNPMVGLYQAPLDNWPVTPGDGYEWKYVDAEDGKTYGITLRDCFDIPDNLYTTEWNIYAVTDDSTGSKTIHWMVQNIEDDNFTEKTKSNLASGITQYYDNGKFLGFNAYGHNLSADSTTSGFVPYTKGVGVSYSDAGQDVYIYFTRRTHKFTYISNGVAVKDPQTLKYQADLTNLGGYEPETAPEGYFFEGWFADPGLSEKFVFNGAKMPNNDVNVYAKWTQIRFRVVFEPRGDDTSIAPSDIIIPNGQSTTFRINYGETVQGANFNQATRDGFTLLGWYLDTDPNNDTVYDTPFSFGMPMTTHDGMADMTYGDASDEERQGIDPWKGNKAYNDADGENDDVVGKITIYARWRQNPDGVVGINIHYIADDKNGNTGSFPNNEDKNYWDDPKIYADKAMAFAQPASVPNNDTLQFLYWEILDKDNNVVGKAYPGMLWEVDIQNAKVTDLTAQAVYVTAPDAEPYEPVNAPEVLPEPEPEELPTREPTRATHTYRAVTQLTPGKKYLITYTRSAGDRGWLMSASSFYSSSIGNSSVDNRPTGVGVTVDNGVITGDYDSYLFGTQYYNGYYVFGSLNNYSYMSMYPSTSYPYVVYVLYENYETYAYWTYNTTTKTLQNRGNTNRYLYLGGSSSSGYYWTTSTSGDPITFYELVEDSTTIQGTDFYRVDSLKDGEKVIIANDNMAMGNTSLSAGHFMNSVAVLHNVTGNESITVSDSDVSSVQWLVEANESNGYYLKNVASGQYLGYDSDYYLTVVNGKTNAYLWNYDAETLDLVNDDATYKYVFYSDVFADFDTTSSSGNDIRIYTAVRTHTVTFVDGCPGANNAVIEAVEVEDGRAATAPVPPVHENYVFDHWDKSFTNVTEDMTVTAVYVAASSRKYTVTFRYMNDQGEWVTAVVNDVEHGSAVTAPVNPRSCTPAGYTFNSWDKRLDNITSNLTVNAVYKLIPTKSYTITLRALYGLKTTEALTHINWYANDGGEANNGAGDCYAQTRVVINAEVPIPTPTTWTAGTWEYSVGSTGLPNPSGLSWAGHTFLGWARVENETGSGQKAHPELTTVDDCWLIWHEDASVSGGGYYTVNLEKDPEYAAAGGTADKHEANVGADEMRPYQDLYAVWSAPHFFVYHSSNGVLEAVEIPVKANGTTSTSFISDTYDITMLVADGYLYGGYYSSYGGVDTEAVDALAAAYVAPTKNNWTLPTQTVRGQSAAYNTRGASIEIDGTDRAFNFVEYTGSSRKNGAKYFWESGNACTANGQTGFTPVSGEVYYLKEVPDDYLGLKYVYIYDELDTNDAGDMKIKEFFQFTLVDDNLYQNIGFRMLPNSDSMKDVMAANVTTKGSLSKSYTITQKQSSDPTHADPISITIDAESFLGEGGGGYVATLKNDAVVNTNFAIVPTWVTKDGVSVGNVPQKLNVPQYQPKDNPNNNVVTSTALEGFIGTEKLYVRSSNIYFWQVDNAITRLYFFGDGDSTKWVDAVKVKDNVYVCTVPTGNWTDVAVLRCNPDPDLVEWNARWNQSVNVSLRDYSAEGKNQVNLYDNIEHVTVYDHQEPRYSAALNELYRP